LCWIRVSTDISIRDLSSVGGLIVPLYSVVAHRNATLWVQSIYFRTSVKDPLTLLVNAILPSENPGPFSVKYYKKYGFV
jgi:hypothetical protein